MVIRLEQYGRAFSTRPRGAEVAQVVADSPDAGDAVLDFTNVLAVSYSFADELVGQLAATTPLRVIGASDDVRAVLARSIERRGASGVVFDGPAAGEPLTPAV